MLYQNMKTSIAVLVLLFGLALAKNILQYENDPDHFINPEKMEDIKSKAQTWEPLNIEDNKFAQIPIKELRKILGLNGVYKNVVQELLFDQKDFGVEQD